MNLKLLLLIGFTLITLGAMEVVTIGKEPVKVTFEGANVNFPWIKKGEIFTYRVKADKNSMLVYVYQDPFGNRTALLQLLETDGYNKYVTNNRYINNSPRITSFSCLSDGISKCLAIELNQDQVEDFLQKYCANFIKTVMSNGEKSEIITSQKNFNTKEKNILEKYVLDPSPKIDGNNWRLEFNVRTEGGGVEYWYADGKLSPISIDTVTIKQLEPSKRELTPFSNQQY